MAPRAFSSGVPGFTGTAAALVCVGSVCASPHRLICTMGRQRHSMATAAASREGRRALHNFMESEREGKAPSLTGPVAAVTWQRMPERWACGCALCAAAASTPRGCSSP